MNTDEINLILEAHLQFLAGEANGIRANLRKANLTGADLRKADLTGADLTGADLTGAIGYQRES